MPDPLTLRQDDGSLFHGFGDRTDNHSTQGFSEQSAHFLFDYDRLEAIAAPFRVDVARRIMPLRWSAEPLARSFAARLISLVPFGLFLLICYGLDMSLSLGLCMLIAPVVMFRIAVLSKPMPPETAQTPLADDALPFYSVLVPLYREAGMIGQLITHLDRLDYPKHRREVLLLLESDDHMTRIAALSHALPQGFQIIIVPEGAPRTKPRALNEGLKRARGELVVVYDAEDRPHPDQLRRAADVFAQDAKLGCVQAHLVIDNADAHWLTRVFAFEYALQFDALIPRLGMSAWPVTLGGSSNHFRRDALDEVGGWDAWNVTEDADLGIRFARLGFSVRHVQSDTLEDAPETLQDWFMQRRRWLKGWLITAIVHLREPVSMVRQIGLLQTLLISIQSLGLVLSVLFWPLTLGLVPWLVFKASLTPMMLLIALLPVMLCLPAILVPMIMAGHNRGLRLTLKDALIWPCYFLLVSAAGWMSVIEFILRPAGWNKTPHQPHMEAAPPDIPIRG